MEIYSKHVVEDVPFIIPPGFRFRPTELELIIDLLLEKVRKSSFSAAAIGEVDFNKHAPCELPWMAKMGEDEWYFFSRTVKKYLSSSSKKINRATPNGYWKVTGKHIKIYEGETQVGLKKILVFYEGNAPKGEKSDWVLHEYKLAGKYEPCNLPNSAENDWVICRVFKKTSGGKKTQISNLTRPMLPPQIDSPPNLSQTITTTVHETCNATCFSGAMGTAGLIASSASYHSCASNESSIPDQSCPPRIPCSMNVVSRDIQANITQDGGGGLGADICSLEDLIFWQRLLGPIDSEPFAGAGLENILKYN